MPVSDVWIVYLELGSGSFGQEDERGGHAGGAFVERYLPAANIEAAVSGARAAAIADDYTVVDIERAFRFDPEEWDDENDPAREVRDAADQVARTGDALYGSFRLFPAQGTEA
jgi:hypothetical protein